MQNTAKFPRIHRSDFKVLTLISFSFLLVFS